MRYIFLIFFIVSSLSLIVNNANAIAYFPPPLKQISNGILPEDVACTEGLVLVLKSSNNLPSCIKPSSVEELIQRGWATEISLSQSIDNSVLDHLHYEDEIAKKAKEILDYALAQEQSISEGEYIEGPTDDGYPIVFYDVFGNDIVLSQSPSLPSSLSYLQQDTEKHQEIWNIFIKLIPESSRNVNVFYLTTDGEDGIGGGIERDVDNISMWNLFYDILDVYPDEFIDDKETIYTTIHEYGHIVTSGTDQIDVDLQLINLSDDENFDELFQTKSESCYPNVLVSDGCAKSASYINLFYQKFWTDIVAEWDDIQYIEDENEFVDQSDLFYEKYQDQFVSVYSSTNVDEDIAESWTAFVLNDKPLGVTISEQKIGFFYDFPELVEIRDHIRKELI